MNIFLIIFAKDAQMYYLCTLQVCVRMRRVKCPIAENILNKNVRVHYYIRIGSKL